MVVIMDMDWDIMDMDWEDIMEDIMVKKLRIVILLMGQKWTPSEIKLILSKTLAK